MKSLARPSFFRLFELLLSRGNPGLKKSAWMYEGMAFERERHSFAGPKYDVVLEIYTLTATGRRRWSLMVVKEHWWVGSQRTALRDAHWAKPLSGQRADIMAWLREKERQFDSEIASAERGVRADLVEESEEM